METDAHCRYRRHLKAGGDCTPINVFNSSLLQQSRVTTISVNLCTFLSDCWQIWYFPLRVDLGLLSRYEKTTAKNCLTRRRIFYSISNFHFTLFEAHGCNQKPRSTSLYRSVKTFWKNHYTSMWTIRNNFGLQIVYKRY